MKILKIISIVSYLLIEGIQLHSTLNVGLILLGLYQFIHDLLTISFINIFWEGFIAIPLIGTIIIFFLTKKYKERYLFLFCFISLLLAAINFTGVLNPDNHIRLYSLWFIVPSCIFILSSLAAIVLYFKKPIEMNKVNAKN